MPSTNKECHSSRALPNAAEALAYTVTDAKRVARIGRTKLYELIGSGALRAMKCGGRTLICADSLRRYLAHLPTLPAKGR
jgi:excisionase family DNA binding protein